MQQKVLLIAHQLSTAPSRGIGSSADKHPLHIATNIRGIFENFCNFLFV